MTSIPDNPVGFHADIPEDEYHAHPTSLSVSGAKVLLRSPARFQYERLNPVRKDTFDFGHAAHAEVLGIGAPLEVVDADDWRTKAAREAKDAAHEAGKVPLLVKDFTRVMAMADRLRGHTRAMELLAKGTPEVSAFAYDEVTGVLRRGRFDWLSDDLTDYKTAASAEPEAFAKAAANYGYHQQDAWYQDLAADLGHPNDGLHFIVQEKEPPFEVAVYRLDHDARRLGRSLNDRALARFRSCMTADHWPGYVPDSESVTLSLPRWAFKNDAVPA